MTNHSRIRSPWRRLVLSLSLGVLGWINKLDSSRARVHWVGRFERRRRHERVVFALLFMGSMLLLKEWQFVFWAVMWGGALSIFLSLHALYRLIPRKRYHWLDYG